MKKSNVIDLASLDTTAACNQGFEVELKHPATNKPVGIFWKVVGRDSDIFREYIREKANDRIRREAAALKRGKELEVRTVEQAESDNIELMTVCSTGWRTEEGSTLKFNGQELEFNVPNAKAVLTALPWIRNQLDAVIGDLENFMKD